jgi:perosamine synthetase
MRYFVASPDLTGNEQQYVGECVRSGWVSSRGEFLDRFEAQIREYAGVDSCVAVANGTVALHLALLAADLGLGDEVILPSLTYVATANAAAYCRATPVFADCDPATGCMDPESVRRLITPKTRALLPVHLFGCVGDMDALGELAQEHGLWLIEDAAEALGASRRGRQAGSLGDLATLSFFGNKIVTTGEGGMVLTRHPRLAKKVRFLANQAMDPEKRYRHSSLGYNYRLTNLAAAVGVAQMERLGQFLERRQALARWYDERLAAVPGLQLPDYPADVVPSNWMYVVRLARAAWREPVMARLQSEGIETRPCFFPVHEFPMYRHCRTDGGCPVSTGLSACALCLPTSSMLTEADADVIAGAVRRAVNAARLSVGGWGIGCREHLQVA